jgi:hypothetical protein
MTRTSDVTYEIYPERDEQPGRELDNWLQAGGELGMPWRAEAGISDAGF